MTPTTTTPPPTSSRHAPPPPAQDKTQNRSAPAPPSTDNEAAYSVNHEQDRERWWTIHLFRGILRDLRRRAPYYASDWTDAWDYRVVPATVYMYFANILPALAFSLDMFASTDSSFGVNEVLLASVLGSVLFALFSCQPLVIVGVTGPITVFNYTVYNIMQPTGVNYLGFMCWIGIWSLILHWILAITNSCNWLRWVTRFPCDIFGFYVAFIYLQKGIQVLERLGDGDGDAFYLSIVAALLVFMVAYVLGELGSATALFHHHVRVFLRDYGTPLTIIFFTGFVHLGRMGDTPLEVLPTGTAFMPTADRNWVVPFWDLSVGDIFLALPFAVLLTILFWFDHNVSSLIAQGTEFPLRKPPGFHWDIFLLGLIIGISGILGLPFPNGLIPQAPFHTEALTVRRVLPILDEKGQPTGGHVVEPTHVVEQRVSNLAQGLLTLVTMTAPLLTVLHLVPHGVLAGLFFIMGVQALIDNGMTAKMLYLARDRTLTSPSHPLRALPRRRAIWAFVAVELFAFGATFAITQTIAAVGFPVVIMLLIPVRALLLPKWFTAKELATLDAPTASPFTMENVGGGSFGGASGRSSIDDGRGGASDGVGGLSRSSSAAVGWEQNRDERSRSRLGRRRTRSQEGLAEEGFASRRSSIQRGAY
ncbi:putative chloride-bicarbonate anion exchanger AE2 [Sodiomyces alkalinus F11]|uniref:Putative chloride-bicarbonate anion exchanger AE2 n=1 Tax=Sodiomyces alkalinus (strain CBS 110278 / VKM F-3762 / F11) TaxID=1314773 RepID=A0A3N2PXV8_SODAK|nr:putative chloride-bicarbonate anion exchanger AE2 [Sodiomyces alkalinus F11]ROT39246.1 putative chloride-bicarbonate anion exchanger AE2 [Sodiomyces alkalinus F11]